MSTDGAADRVDLPGPAVDVRRPGQHADPGPPGPPARRTGRDDRGPLRPALTDQGDIYLLGGGEDGPQALAAQRLIADRGLHRRPSGGATLFAVCAGYQLVGTSFFAKGEKCAGLDLLDLHSDRGPSRAWASWPARPTRLSACRRSRASRTTAAAPIWAPAPATRDGRVGIGNDGTTEGVWRGKILGTYMHGPALARNPALADLLVALGDRPRARRRRRHLADRLRAERLQAVGVR